MTIIDIVIIVLALVGGVIGWRKGLTGQVGAIFALIFAIVMCRWFGQDAVAYFTDADDSLQTRLLTTILVYIALAAVSYLGVRLLAGFVGLVFKALHISVINRGAGALFGAFEYLLGLSLLLNLWVAIFKETELRSSSSTVNEALLDLAPSVLGSETAREILAAPFADKPE